jgi:hypothetical protein
MVTIHPNIPLFISLEVAKVADARALFDPTYRSPAQPIPPGWTLPALTRLIRMFYGQRIAWAALVMSAAILIYGGGALMFWYHSIYLGEGGPAISPWLHWFVDSTAGFVALVPALVLILPVAARHAWRHPGPEAGLGALRATYFALASGTLFALATVPGPVLHDNFVGRGTWFANQLTRLFGDGRTVPPPHHFAAPVSMSLQLAFALPVYILLMWVSLMLVRQAARRWHLVR